MADDNEIVEWPPHWLRILGRALRRCVYYIGILLAVVYIVETHREDSETWRVDSIFLVITVVWAIISDLRWQFLGYKTLQVSIWGFLLLFAIAIGGYFIGELSPVFIFPMGLGSFLTLRGADRQCHGREMTKQGADEGGTTP